MHIQALLKRIDKAPIGNDRHLSKIKMEHLDEFKAADKMGDMPAYNPSPMPPKEAWVIPPLMNTNRRVTIYVPIMPQAMLARRLPRRAC